jgi:hypothetical protein
LGLCYKCAEITNRNWNTDCAHQTGNCSYNIPGVAQFNIKNQNGSSTFIFESKEVSPKLSKQWFNINNSILTLASLKLSYNNNERTQTYPPQNITLCTMYSCVYKAQGKVDNGKPSFNMVGSWRNESAHDVSRVAGALDDEHSLPDVIMTPTRQDLGFDNDEPFKRSTYFIPSPVVNLMRTTLRATLVLRVFYEDNSTDISSLFTYSGFGNTALGGWAFALSGGQWESSFEAVALAATYYIAALTENGVYQVSGYILDRFTVINVRWWWITLPASLFGATVILLVITVSQSRNMPTWKNSIIPLVFSSRLREEAGLCGALDEEEMKQTAGRMVVGVERVGTGMELTFLGVSTEPNKKHWFFRHR